VLRIAVFYIGSMLVVVTLLPWTSIRPGTSPYVAVLDHIGVPAAAQIMNVVVFVALLSALNANLYGASRMVFSLAERGEAPRGLLRVTDDGVPRRAVLASVAFGFVSVLLNLRWPHSVFLYLLNSVGAVLLVVWGLICGSQLRLRRRIEREAPHTLSLRMWAFPWLSWAALLGMLAVLALMLGDPGARPQVVWSGAATGVVLVAAAVREWRGRSGIRDARHNPGIVDE
jgi:aromatic amino acid permease